MTKHKITTTKIHGYKPFHALIQFLDALIESEVTNECIEAMLKAYCDTTSALYVVQPDNSLRVELGSVSAIIHNPANDPNAVFTYELYDVVYAVNQCMAINGVLGVAFNRSMDKICEQRGYTKTVSIDDDDNCNVTYSDNNASITITEITED